jgi:D-cysteine desulfhydrase
MDPIELGRKIRAVYPPCSLGRWPTPLEQRPDLAAAAGREHLWLKREDLSATAYGGNKVRGLEFLLAGRPTGTVCVTIGGIGSTHCLATATHTRTLGLRSVLAQFPQPETPASREVAAACAARADLAIRSGSRATLPFAVWRAWRSAGRLGPRHWIPGGGATPRAVLGHLLAGLELASQLSAPPEAVVVPLGSGSTTAGLALAMAALEWPTTVVAVRVAPTIVANRWRVNRLARQAARLLRPLGFSFSVPPAALAIQDGLGRGYGYPTPAGASAADLATRHGVTLDPTYGAKAFAALRSLPASFRRVVFWHTFAAP